MDNELNNSKLTLVVGATNNPERYAYKAAELLQSKGFDFLPIGIKKGMVLGKEILDLHQLPSLTGIHTLTLYLGPENQSEWIDYLIGIKPVRVLFNPGTENPLFFQKAREAGIDVQNVCTLVILTTGQF
ncbi:MAG: CoA-binding protein [Bacteroidetes bacterium]|nr:CoA-binding protein [Bacteroidota bacterium]MDA1269303.1 CoA-binding protein [Bacteroidota bacterium]